MAQIPDGVSLTPDNVDLVEDDETTIKAAEVKSFRDSAWKLNLALCIDTSGTMAGKPLKDTQKALKRVLTERFFNPQDRIALMAFQNKPRIIHWYGDYNESSAKIDLLAWKQKEKEQNTVLYDALFEALMRLQNKPIPQPPALQRILVISDGKDEGSQRSIIEVEEKASALGVAIDVVTRVRKDRVQEDLREGFVQNLRALAHKTGGKFEHAEPDQVFEAVEAILQSIFAFQVVNFKRELAGDEPLTKSVALQIKSSNGPIRFNSPEQIARTPPLPKEARWSNWLWWFALILALCAIWLIKRRSTKPPDMVEPSEPERQVTTPKPKAMPEPSNEMHLDTKNSEGPTKTEIGGYYFPTPTSEKPTALLFGIEGPLKGQQYAIDKPIFTIGAGSGNDLALADDDFASADHAYLRQEKGSLFVFDKGSLNGTFVNDHQLTDVGVALQLDDRIKIGSSTFRIAQAQI